MHSTISLHLKSNPFSQTSLPRFPTGKGGLPACDLPLDLQAHFVNSTRRLARQASHPSPIGRTPEEYGIASMTQIHQQFNSNHMICSLTIFLLSNSYVTQARSKTSTWHTFRSSITQKNPCPAVWTDRISHRRFPLNHDERGKQSWA